MTEEEVVERGIRSDALLGSKTFAYVVGILSENYANSIIQSEPHERTKREDAYHHSRALSDIVSTLNGYVAAKDEIVRQRELEQETDKD